MNRAVTIAFINGTPKVITGPEIPYPQQNADFKRLVQESKGGATCDALELWTSSAGVVKRKRFPAAQPAGKAPVAAESMRVTRSKRQG